MWLICYSYALILMVTFIFQQDVKKESHWVIKEVITTYVQKGPKDHFELPPKETLIGKTFLLSKNKLESSKSLKDTFIGADAFEIGKLYKLRLKLDDTVPEQYPGTELYCLNDRKKTDSCYVGKKFLSLLKAKSNNLEVYEVKNLKTGSIYYKLCLTGKKEMALFSENDFLILILECKE